MRQIAPLSCGSTLLPRGSSSIVPPSFYRPPPGPIVCRVRSFALTARKCAANSSRRSRISPECRHRPESSQAVRGSRRAPRLSLVHRCESTMPGFVGRSRLRPQSHWKEEQRIPGDEYFQNQIANSVSWHLPSHAYTCFYDLQTQATASFCCPALFS